MGKKKQQDANCEVVLEKHMSSVISARCTTALCYREIVSKMHTENDSNLTTVMCTVNV